MIFRHLLNMRSHPTWVRGLKLDFVTRVTRYKASHPTWVRGLKLTPTFRQPPLSRRTLRGCVD